MRVSFDEVDVVLEGLWERKTIPPVVARIFSGDSTSPLTREERTWCEAKNGADAKAYKHT